MNQSESERWAEGEQAYMSHAGNGFPGTAKTAQEYVYDQTGAIGDNVDPYGKGSHVHNMGEFDKPIPTSVTSGITNVTSWETFNVHLKLLSKAQLEALLPKLVELGLTFEVEKARGIYGT
jgi:hypothetical protein